MVLAIKRLLYDERYTIAGARQQLRELGLSKALEGAVDPTSPAVDVPISAENSDAAVAALRTGYRRIRRELEAIRDSL
jgi:hypothetical protein